MKPLRIGHRRRRLRRAAHLPALQHASALRSRRDRVASEGADVAAEANPHAFRSCQEMLAGCELDAVTVASPPFAHARTFSQRFGPASTCSAKSPSRLERARRARMLDAAAAAGTACGVSHEFRFVPQAQRSKSSSHNGHLGSLAQYRDHDAAVYAAGREALRERSWWFERERGGGLPVRCYRI